MSSQDVRFGVSIKAAAEHQRRLEREDQARRDDRYRRAKTELDAALAHIRVHFTPRRIIVWGSILAPERFTELSDLDICVEGIDDWAEWSRLERDLLEITTLPLDLVKWESLQPIHQRRILERGEVVYESA